VTQHSGFGRQDVARCWAGFASFGAGLVHVAVVNEHLREYRLFGIFFAVLGIAQILWGVAAFARPTVPFPQLTGAVTLGVLALWMVSRTVGLPIGPEPWTAEAAARPDVLCAVLEVALLLCLVAAAPRRSPEPAVDGGSRGAIRYVSLLFAGALAVSAVATPAMAASESGEHAEPHFTHSSH